jgi:hypothetical protein
LSDINSGNLSITHWVAHILTRSDVGGQVHRERFPGHYNSRKISGYLIRKSGKHTKLCLCPGRAAVLPDFMDLEPLGVCGFELVASGVTTARHVCEHLKYRKHLELQRNVGKELTGPVLCGHW